LPAAPLTATLIVGFHVAAVLLGSLEMSYSRQNTPTHCSSFDFAVSVVAAVLAAAFAGVAAGLPADDGVAARTLRARLVAMLSGRAARALVEKVTRCILTLLTNF